MTFACVLYFFVHVRRHKITSSLIFYFVYAEINKITITLLLKPFHNDVYIVQSALVQHRLNKCFLANRQRNFFQSYKIVIIFDTLSHFTSSFRVDAFK